MPSTARASRRVTEQPRAARPTQFAAPQGCRSTLDEAGEQTVVTGHEAAYDGTPENVDADQRGAAVDEPRRARRDRARATRRSRPLLYFPLIDDTGISTGFQSGNLFADLAKKQSYAGMKAKIASAKGICQGGVAGIPQSWSHTDAGDRRTRHLRRPRHRPGLPADRTSRWARQAHGRASQPTRTRPTRRRSHR